MAPRSFCVPELDRHGERSERRSDDKRNLVRAAWEPAQRGPPRREQERVTDERADDEREPRTFLDDERDAEREESPTENSDDGHIERTGHRPAPQTGGDGDRL